MMFKDSKMMVVNLSPIVNIIPRNCGPTCCAVHDGVLTTVVVEMSMLQEASDAVVDMDILNDGVNMTVCVDVSITVDITGCGLSPDIISSVN